jgi:hypothetical protein
VVPNGRQVAFSVRWYTGYEDEIEHSAVYIANRDGSRKRLLRRNA